MLLTQEMPKALLLARANAGNRRPARMAMMAITTNNSINVKARRDKGWRAWYLLMLIAHNYWFSCDQRE
jgi:hypothetical protein